MEDACSIVGEFAGPRTQMYGVFDGHGGKETSEYCAAHFHHLLAAQYAQSNDMRAALVAAIVEINSVAVGRWSYMGTTLAVAAIAEDTIYTANVGDTRLVLINEGIARRVSYDHKVSDGSEHQEVLNRGGNVVNGRVGGRLALSRAIGDGALADILSVVPYMTEHKRTDDTWLIIACDGVWDVMSDQEAADLLREADDPGVGARKIKDEALAKGSDDNVTVVCLRLMYKQEE